MGRGMEGNKNWRAHTTDAEAKVLFWNNARVGAGDYSVVYLRVSALRCKRREGRREGGNSRV